MWCGSIKARFVMVALLGGRVSQIWFYGGEEGKKAL